MYHENTRLRSREANCRACMCGALCDLLAASAPMEIPTAPARPMQLRHPTPLKSQKISVCIAANGIPKVQTWFLVVFEACGTQCGNGTAMAPPAMDQPLGPHVGPRDGLR